MVETEKMNKAVEEFFKTSEQPSMSKWASALKISIALVWIILQKDFASEAYKVSTCQLLKQSDIDARLTFKAEMREKIEDGTTGVNKISFSDETHFYLHETGKIIESGDLRILIACSKGLFILSFSQFGLLIVEVDSLDLFSSMIQWTQSGINWCWRMNFSLQLKQVVRSMVFGFNRMVQLHIVQLMSRIQFEMSLEIE